MSDKTLSPEIVKLMDKITQNPTSRLFVPLAEEYLKADMVEEAIIVLAEGIKNHPNYVAARVMLGKIYLQKNQIPEAQNEFEQVITVNPENILAYKKLATIYQGQGQPQKALEACKKVLTIDPSDKEAKGLIGVLEKMSASAMPLEKTVDSSIAPAAPSVIEAPVETQTAAEVVDSNAGSPSDSAPSPEPVNLVQEAPAEVSFESSQDPVEASSPVEEVSNQSFQDPPAPGISPAPEEIPAAVVNQVQEGVSSAPISDPIGMETSPAGEEDAWEGDKTVVAGFVIPSSHGESASVPSDKKEEPLLSTTLASLYMSQGHYQEAAEVYQKLLALDPSDEESRQGLEKALQHLAPGNALEPSNPDDSKSKKTRRLQSWLDSIRKKE